MEDVEKCLSDLYDAKLEILELQNENQELKTKLVNLQRWKDEIEKTIMDNTIEYHKTTKKRNKKNQAFINFYELYKNDRMFLDKAKSSLEKLGYLINKVPLSFVKLEAKKIFDNLSDEEKMKYNNK
jgi:hypothetical protein